MKLYLLCPVKDCDHKIPFENKADTAILEYLDVYNRFEKHLKKVHSINQIIWALYHLQIITQFKKKEE